MSILERLSLPSFERVVFKSTPLSLVICQVRFTRLLDVGNVAAVAPFQRALQQEYPNLEEFRETAIPLIPGAGPVAAQTGPSQWRFSDLEGNWTVVLAQEFIAIETRRYERFESFLRRLEDVLAALVRHLRPAAITRVGLRYINEIRPGETDWDRVIRPEALGLLGIQPFSDFLAQSVREEALDFGDGQLIQIRHGLFPGGTTVQPRPGDQPPSSNFYLLDFDVSRTFVRPSVQDMTAGSIRRHVDEYHAVISRLFRWWLTEPFTESLGVASHAT